MCQSMSITKHIERRVVLAEAADDLIDLLIAVGPVARPPRAEGEARRQRNAPGDAHIIAERLAIVVAVAEEVPVLAASPAGRSITHGHGLFSPSRKRKSAESKSGRVESSTSAQPERETSPLPIGSFVFEPERAVERARGALQILRIEARAARRPVFHRRRARR